MPISINYDELATLVDDSTLILTPNSRTQGAVVVGALKNEAERQVVRAPDVLSLSQWLQNLWQEISFIESIPSIIGNLELKTWLKEQIANTDNWQLTNELGVAEKALEAYRNLIQWELCIDDIEQAEVPEHHYFIRWSKQLESFLQDKALIPEFAITNFVLDRLDLVTDRLPTKIVLVGFNQLTPAEKSLFKKCQSFNIEVNEFTAKCSADKVSRIEVLDFRQEVEIAAAIARDSAADSSTTSVAVVVNQLASHLDLVHQIFSDYFQPDESLPWNSLKKCQYNVSAGQPIQQMPMVSAAVKIISFQSSGLDLQSLLFIKNTPYINWGAEEGSIKRFLYQQGLLAYAKYSYHYLINAIDQSPESSKLSVLRQRIDELQNRQNYSRTMTAWGDFWNSVLRQWGWCHEYDFDEAEQKLLVEFKALIKQTSKLAIVYKKVKVNLAREFLLQLLKQTAFQLPSDRTNVHVLGVLEASGLVFDKTILVGFNRDNWPQKVKSNPFLPIAFQQANAMPSCSAEREFEYAQSLSQSLLQSASQIWITESVAADDELSTASPFFIRFPTEENINAQILEPLLPVTPDYHWRYDDNVELPAGKISGGAYLLGQYASCPFKAMARFQFQLRGTQQQVKGIEAKTKGAWLHRSMELLWDELKTQAKLLSLSPTEIKQQVARILETSKSEFESELFASAPAEIIDIEYQKLISQICEWLELEKTRKPFEVETEVDKSLRLGQLEFKFRVDRIDRITNDSEQQSGSIEIIDYKTGQTDFKKWLGKRPEEAQMPAYVLACSDEMIESLSYAKIKTGEISISGVWFNEQKSNQKSDDKADETTYRFLEKGLGQEKDKTKYLQSNAELIDRSASLAQQWKRNLEALVEKISSGDMPVSPKSRTESCRYCEFSAFCRISETQPEAEELTVSDTGKSKSSDE
ncbi:PD-(D/E)XK nuclease family protein [Aliikangiella coralliicola]|uniref:PD-(D/E)XK endonuclease-like domain-containing protein n=1 Tax=Aliikangiella coralliicola TaxID=2592383 RepID=A0A545UAM8_9GAMM|nr:PD-(D/E)XK nuclease family protein [Aliikangiella coralliicola]TQV86524.1 hypothetical protein FLL46_16580 [Aliikangiella coralliicola]